MTTEEMVKINFEIYSDNLFKMQDIRKDIKRKEAELIRLESDLRLAMFVETSVKRNLIHFKTIAVKEQNYGLAENINTKLKIIGE